MELPIVCSVVRVLAMLCLSQTYLVGAIVDMQTIVDDELRTFRTIIEKTTQELIWNFDEFNKTGENTDGHYIQKRSLIDSPEEIQFYHSFVSGTGIGNRQEVYPMYSTPEMVTEYTFVEVESYNDANNKVILMTLDDGMTSGAFVYDGITLNSAYDFNGDQFDGMNLVRNYIVANGVFYNGFVLTFYSEISTTIYENSFGASTELSQLRITEFFQKSGLYFFIHMTDTAYLLKHENGGNLIQQEIGSSNDYSSSLSYSINDYTFHLIMSRADASNVDLWTWDEINLKFHLIASLIGSIPCHFTYGYQHYIVTASPTVSRIYKWNDYEYVLFQVLEMADIQHWEPVIVPSSQDMLMLLATANNSNTPFALFRFSVLDSMFLHIDIDGFPDCNLSSYDSHSFYIDSNVYIMFLCENAIIHKLEYNITEVTNPVIDQNDKLLEEVEILEEIIETLDSDRTNVSNIFDDSMTTNTDQVVYTMKAFENEVTVEDVIHVDYIHVSGFAHVPTENRTLERIIGDFNDQGQSVIDIQERLHHFLTVDTNQTIQILIHFENLIADTGIITTILGTRILNNVDIEELYQFSLKVHIPGQIIDGTLLVDNAIFESNIVINSGYFNSVNFSRDMLTTDSEQEVFSSLTLIGYVTMNGNLTGFDLLFNGIDISEDILTLNGIYRLHSNLTFLNQVSVYGNLVADHFEGFDITNYANVLTKNMPQFISGSIRFYNILKFENNVDIGARINAMDLSELYVDALKVYKDNVIMGNVTFLQDFNVVDDVNIHGFVDGTDLSDMLLTLHDDQEIVGKMIIKANLTMDCDARLLALINGIDLSEDVVLISHNQTITGIKLFLYDVFSADYISSSATIDGVSMMDFELRAMTVVFNEKMSGIYTFKNVDILSNSYVFQDVNEVNIIKLYGVALLQNVSKIQHLYGHIIFSKNVSIHAGQFYINSSINGYEIDIDMLDNFSNQKIVNTKIWHAGFNVRLGITADFVDSVDLIALAGDIVMNADTQIISGDKRFYGNLLVRYGKLYVTENIDDIQLNDVLNAALPRIVTGSKTFHHLQIQQKLTVSSNIHIINHLNFIKIGSLDEKVFKLSTEQEIIGKITFADNFSVRENVDMSDCLNYISNIRRFSENVLSKTRKQSIGGIKTITGYMAVDADTYITDATIDDINLEDLKHGIWFLNTTVYIAGAKRFADLVTVIGHIDVNGTVQETDLLGLANDIVTKDRGPRTIYGQKWFQSCISIDQNLNTNNISNIDISRAFLTSDSIQNVKGTFTFEDILVSMNINVHGLINHINLTELTDVVLTTNTEQFILGNIMFLNNLHIANDIMINGSVHNVNWEMFLTNAIFKNQPAHIIGITSLLGLVVLNHDLGIIPTKLNGYPNFKMFEYDVVRHNNLNITLEKYLEFRGNVTVLGDMTLYGNISTSTGFIYGLNVIEYIENTLMSTGNQNITGFPTFQDITIKGNIELNGLINGIDLGDIITLHSDENIFGWKIFSDSVSSTSNIRLTEYLNGINISDIVKDSFDANVEQLILATKMFDNPVRILGNLIGNGTLEGLYIDREVVTLTTEETIVGLKNFVDVLHVEGDINLGGLIGGGNISTLARTRITLNNSHILTNCYFIDTVTFLKDILLADHIDGIAIDRLEDLYFSFFENVQDDIDALNFIASSQCERIEQLQESFSLVVAELDFTEVMQSWNQPVRMFESFTTDSGQLYLLMIVHSEDSDVCSDSFLYRWNTTGASFDLYDSFKTSGAVSVNTLITDDNTVHIVIASTAPQICTENARFYMQFVGGILSPLDTIVPILSTSEFDLKATEDGLLVLFTGNEVESSTSIQGLPRGEDVLVLIQDFPDVIATSAEFIDIDNQTFIVFAERDLSTSRIYNAYLNNTVFTETDPFSSFQEIPTVNPLDVCAFEHQETIGFAVANHGVLRDGHTDYNVYITVYHWSYTTNAFILHDSIPFYRTSDIEIFSVGPALYMAAVSQYSHVTIFKHEGTSGFQAVLQLDVSGVYTCHASNAPDDTILLALASEPQRGSAVSYILKAVFNGKAIEPSEGLCKIVLPSYHSEHIH